MTNYNTSSKFSVRSVKKCRFLQPNSTKFGSSFKIFTHGTVVSPSNSALLIDVYKLPYKLMAHLVEGVGGCVCKRHRTTGARNCIFLTHFVIFSLQQKGNLTLLRIQQPATCLVNRIYTNASVSQSVQLEGSTSTGCVQVSGCHTVSKWKQCVV